MAKVQKKCPSCGKVVNVDVDEIYCPFCEDYLENIEDYDDKKVKDKNKPEKDKNLSSLVKLTNVGCVLGIVLLAFILLTFFTPKLVYQFLHYGWAIGILAGLSIIIIVIVFKSVSKNDYVSSASKAKKFISLKIVLSVFSVLASIGLFTYGALSMQSKTFSISNTQEFNILANMPFASKCNYYLETNLNFEGNTNSGWGAIGNFYGEFDGRGHKISNLKVDAEIKETEYSYLAGLVCSNEGVIKNLQIDNCEINVKGKESSYYYVGSIAGRNRGEISNCRLTDTSLSSDCISREVYLGGIAGLNEEGTISHCEFVNTGTSGKNEGGIYADSYSNYRVIISSVGGIVGQLDGGTIQDCFSNTNINNVVYGYNNYVYSGGICGDVDNSYHNLIQSCISYTTSSYKSNEQDSSSETTKKLGTLIGYVSAYCEISNCYATSSNLSFVGNKSVDASEVSRISEGVLPNYFSGWHKYSNGITPCTGFKE